ncbi:N-acetyllactosaminide beta-1,3-N-acetylglucosaminyltransferase 2-like [Mugil cephalus]|uniref:N-acetyllactosaminide beta-1,3-N-acetylglucosaminyltransferase 2-like n=1 Tax=Mugil cephalus TaxID=48193 RepID=UPI001FB5D6A4|nr:N-acetyllactosaminide beta-1,3-N-acetylglucosaminyltransferase 2-like [Mugil cephalus]
MARCRCRWRSVLICVCTQCLLLVTLFLFAAVSVCLNMQENSEAQPVFKPKQRITSHFVAAGVLRNGTFGPFPETFWKRHDGDDGIWNRLQLSIDHRFNPILRPRVAERGLKRFGDSILKQSFSTYEVSPRENVDKLPKRIQEFVSHMQRRDYPVLLQPDACGARAKGEEEVPLLLLAIKSTEMNIKNRQAIRQTWGKVGWVAGQKTSGGAQVGGYVRRVFLLGREKFQELGVDMSALVKTESQLYGDILQWDFEDTFFNLTLKDVLFWSWFSRSCGQTRFVFKGDDDVFVNTAKMVTYLHGQLREPNVTMEDFMVGEVIGAALPNRVNKSKYFIPHTFYKGLYPTYAGGGGVVYSGLLTKRLHHMSKRVHLFPIDDVYVGMCMVRLNAFPIHHPAFLTFDFPGKEEDQQCSYHTILMVHKRSPNQVMELWSDLEKTEAQCRDVPLRVEGKNKH